jgi:hypothetical protein
VAAVGAAVHHDVIDVGSEPFGEGERSADVSARRAYGLPEDGEARAPQEGSEPFRLTGGFRGGDRRESFGDVGSEVGRVLVVLGVAEHRVRNGYFMGAVVGAYGSKAGLGERRLRREGEDRESERLGDLVPGGWDGQIGDAEPLRDVHESLWRAL